MIKRFLIILMMSLLTFSMVIGEAHAKRFGGGRSFGVSRSTNNYYRAPNNNFNKAAASSPTQSRIGKGLAALGGLALGGLLASLFMGNGLGSGILMWLMVGLVIFMLMRLWRSKFQPAWQSKASQNNDHQFMQQATNANQYDHSYQPHAYASAKPVGFDEAQFLREAKVQFVRLQAAYDQKNLADIREFTTPEVFAEVQLQLQERGNAINQTEVVRVEAALLDVSQEEEASSNSAMPIQIASVRFSGEISEESQPAESFSEIWHFRKDIMSGRWVVAGLQQ